MTICLFICFVLSAVPVFICLFMNLFHSPFLPLDSFAHLVVAGLGCCGLFWVVFGCLHFVRFGCSLCLGFCCVVSIVSICLFAAGWLLAAVPALADRHLH